MSSHSNFPAKLRDFRAPEASAFVRLLTVALLCAFATVAQPQAAHSGAAQAPGATAPSAAFASLSQRAMEALDADHLQEAIPLFRKALALNPKWAEGWWSLGTSYYDEELYAEAQLAFKRVVALDAKNGTARAFLGLCEFELGDEKSALRDIEASKDLGTDIDPQLRKVVFYHEGVLLQRAGRFVAAEKPFAWLCLNSPGSVEVSRGFGMATLRMRDRQFPPPGTEAATVTEQVGHAACSAAQKNFDSAREQLTAIVAAHPHFPYLHYAFGRVLLDASDTPGAIAEFKLEIETGRDQLLPLLEVAACEYKIDPGAGLPYAQQAVALAPKLPFAHFVLGLLLENTGEEEKAIPELEIARAAFPNDQKVYWALATVYARTGRMQEAAKARAEVARLHRDSEQDGTGANEGQFQDAPINVTDAAEQGSRN